MADVRAAGKAFVICQGAYVAFSLHHFCFHDPSGFGLTGFPPLPTFFLGFGVTIFAYFLQETTLPPYQVTCRLGRQGKPISQPIKPIVAPAVSSFLQWLPDSQLFLTDLMHLVDNAEAVGNLSEFSLTPREEDCQIIICTWTMCAPFSSCACTHSVMLVHTNTGKSMRKLWSWHFRANQAKFSLHRAKGNGICTGSNNSNQNYNIFAMCAKVTGMAQAHSSGH